MLKNNYLTFGNSIMQKYSGMTSRINPLALIFLQTEEEEEQPPQRPVQVTNVHNTFYHTNHYIYNRVVNRYVQNYNEIVTLLKSNTLYAGSLNFKADIHPVQLSHTAVQTTENVENVVKETTRNLLKEYIQVSQNQETTTEVVVKKLTEGMSSDSLKILPLKVREEIFAEITKEVQEKILPVVQKQTDYTILTTENTALLQKSVQTVIEQNAARLPDAVIKESAAKLTKELSVRLVKELEHASVSQETEHITDYKEIIRNILIRQIEPYIMAMSPGTSRFVIRQEIEKLCQKDETAEILIRELDTYIRSEENQKNTVVISETIQSLIQKITEHTDTCRKGKEKYERQIVSRLMPLPIRPVHLEYAREQKEAEDAVQEPSKEESRIFQQKVVQILKKEQTAESKYYTHFIEKFLKKTKEQVTEQIDRSTLPAGIIYHQKPKENVQFISKDVIQLPEEVLAKQVRHEPKAAADRITDEVRNEIVNKTTQEVVHQIEAITEDYQEYAQRRVIRRRLPDFTFVQNETRQMIFSRPEALELVLLTGGETGQEQDGAAQAGKSGNRVLLQDGIVYVPDGGTSIQDVMTYVKENIIPVQSAAVYPSGNGISGSDALIYAPNAAADLQGSVTGGAGNTAGNMTGNPAFPQGSVFHTTGSATTLQSGVFNIAGNVSALQGGVFHTAGSVTALQDSVSNTAGGAAVNRMPVQREEASGQQLLEVAPVNLVHKREENNGRHREDKKSDTQAAADSKEEIPDIVFTKDIVTKQNIDEVITENVQRRQQVLQTGQAVDLSAAGQSQGMMTGQSVIQQTEQIPAARVEKMISESVSRHMDENIQEISRQVYHTLERRIKKEQERRGL